MYSRANIMEDEKSKYVEIFKEGNFTYNNLVPVPGKATADDSH